VFSELSDAYIDEVSTHLDAVSGATLTSGAVAAGFQEVVEQAQAAEVTE
ncbi:MAG: FMN-binding protein, partial [Lachnospiraceae bacterium]|nr:FMN-binding protein [Lachnospiraceae bacterium]